MCVQALQDSGVKNVLALAKVSVAYAICGEQMQHPKNQPNAYHEAADRTCRVVVDGCSCTAVGGARGMQHAVILEPLSMCKVQ